MPGADLTIALFAFVLLIFSLSAHECAHAWMASRLGDHTARMQGRVTLNPMVHVDPVGTLLFPALAIFGPFIGLGALGGMLIGWAKPTPVISRNFKHIRRDENLVTLAGPGANLLIALVAIAVLAAIAKTTPGGGLVVVAAFRTQLSLAMPGPLQALLLMSVLAVEINLGLFIFNLLPIPPLDGSHLLYNALPYNAAQSYARLNPWLGMLLMILVGGFLVRLLLYPLLGGVVTLLARL